MSIRRSLMNRLLFLLFSSVLCSALVTRPASSQDADARGLKSQIMRWEDTKTHTANWGEMHRYFTGSTFATEKVYVATAIVQPGKAVHKAHRHAEEEYLAIVQGTGVWSLDGKEIPAKRGDMLYVEPWVYHGLTNTGDKPLVFLVIKYNGKGVKPLPRPDDRPDELAASPQGVEPQKPPAAKVSGTITMDGQPLAGAKVTFTPTDGRPVSAITDEDGTYKMGPSDKSDGVAQGQYRVTIEKGPGDEGDPKASGPIVPPKYSSASGLVVEVRLGANVFDFALAN